jgi:hypothetical protein
MKKLALLLLAVAGLLNAGGCSSPAYTGEENTGRVLRAWEYERGQMIDDVASHALLLPPSRSTIWNLR